MDHHSHLLRDHEQIHVIVIKFPPLKLMVQNVIDPSWLNHGWKYLTE